jgi:hypothetical protein
MAKVSPVRGGSRPFTARERLPPSLGPVLVDEGESLREAVLEGAVHDVCRHPAGRHGRERLRVKSGEQRPHRHGTHAPPVQPLKN